ncbi:MAG TPA: L,D-transpeptidase family protein [Gemmatimonadaceae bacterium]|nr:L,D-transpeptidase family protein [Gemmatimonadaceae bacterium]
MRTAHLCILILAATVAACKDKGSTPSTAAANNADQSWSPATLTSVAGVPEADVEAALHKRLESDPPPNVDKHKWEHTKKLYKMYNNNPLWLAPDGLHKDRSRALTNAVLNAENDGLRMDTYPIGELAASIAALKQTDKPTADQLARADVALTAAYTSLAVDYLIGQVDPKTVSQSWHIDRHDENEDSAIVRSIRNPALDKSIAGMRPTDDDYAGLVKALAQFRSVAAKGGWPSIPEGKSVKPGESDNPARLAALRARLGGEGIAVPAATDSAATRASNSSAYDRSLAGAVANFQSRHGIVVDSMLGPETVKSLNLPATYRVGQIAANLERFRWLPRSFGSRYVYVNVPAFRLEAYDNSKKVLEMKVIVGEEYEDKATPVFADSMEFVVFRPYWNVPPGIAEKEIFPKGSAYLASNNMETYSEGGATRVRQRPGGKNALGLVKFLFPNDFNIYFHDTPNDELFKKDVRAFSHGCIRLEHPDQMAEYALGWPGDQVHQAMEGGADNRQIKLPKKIPVYIVYGTAYLRDGQLYFGNDLYDRDGTLIKAVAGGALPNPQTVQAVQALRRIAAAG